MSNSRDVSLNEPEVQPLADSEQAHVSRTSLLKRFFKVSKKPLVLDLAENASETSSEDDKKKLRKTKTLSRVFSRKRRISNQDGHEQSTSMGNPISQDMPLTHEKHGIKSSMSVYWKRLFHRQKSQRHGAASGQEMCDENEPVEEEHKHELVQNEPDIQDQPTIYYNLESNQELQPQAVAEPESIRRKKPKKPSPIPSNMSEEPNQNVLEDGHPRVAAAEPEDEQQAPEYSTLYP